MVSTPALQRGRLSQSRAPSSAQRATPREVTPPEMPPYEPPEAPLTAESHRQIATLLQSTQLRQLKTHLGRAVEMLTFSAGEVNDRLCDARVRFEKNKERRWNEEEEGGADGEEHAQLGETETKVNNVTGRMEEKVRQIIDSEMRLQSLVDTMTTIEREEGEAQAAALGSRRTRGQRRQRRRGGDDEDEGEGEEDPDFEATPEREARELNAQNPPSRRLEGGLQEENDKWNELSLTERYAENNSYKGFYRMVHDSKFPGDEVPPLPHTSTWFAHLEDPSAASSTRQRSTRGRQSSVNSDDIAIERERISLKCPLTLLPYRDPVTSTKCPHSFEREAIESMISRSPYQTLPNASGSGTRRVRAVKCPVCSITFSADDLRSDPVLLRRVRRAEEKMAQEAEAEQMGESGRNSPEGVTLNSDGVEDDAMDVDADESDGPRIKSEPAPSQAMEESASDNEEGSNEASSEESESDASGES